MPGTQQLPTAPGSYWQPAAQTQLLHEMYGEAWLSKTARIRLSSPHGNIPSWQLISFIVKSGDDLRQEEFAMQLLLMFQDMFAAARTRLWLRPYQVVSTAADAGLIEVVQDAVSLHHLREKWAELKWPPGEQNLHSYFVKAYGPEHSASFKAAQRNFIESMAAYAVVCYLLRVKDRNDGNLLITRHGHMVHIDFGFMLSNSPGDIAFEQAPFKLTSELVQELTLTRFSLLARATWCKQLVSLASAALLQALQALAAPKHMSLFTSTQVKVPESSAPLATQEHPKLMMEDLMDALQQVMGGKDSASFSYFRELCVQGLLEARRPHNSQVSLHSPQSRSLRFLELVLLSTVDAVPVVFGCRA